MLLEGGIVQQCVQGMTINSIVIQRIIILPCTIWGYFILQIGVFFIKIGIHLFQFGDLIFEILNSLMHFGKFIIHLLIFVKRLKQILDVPGSVRVIFTTRIAH